MASDEASGPPLAVETHGLGRRFGDKVAVEDLSLSVEAGRIFGLLGPNGAGKSTTIKMLITLLAPTSGQACVAGYDIVRQARDVRRCIGYVPQALSADGNLTGRENLVLSTKLYSLPARDRAQRVDEALHFMGLHDSADRLVRTYSGGMIRRLELAQAMLHRPRVLFLDEPTIGLDPVARQAVWERLRSMRGEFHMTVLITTHDMGEADTLCDELAILHAGRVVALDTPARLKESVGPDATLNDVFSKYGGGSIQEGGSFSDVRKSRSVANRLG